ncbi:hypothetical protein CTAYLR_008360 [Chrysophaeum taylorii]|uniref:1,3-beta-glucan synthase n=1 Tax=Chrysophaeum taylorii TaxID=2483200 RepID=A0AAD7UPB9_9STRA|nr:hypothetical protein CTAYLR_008360 [Chrysophaeum taylorii]
MWTALALGVPLFVAGVVLGALGGDGTASYLGLGAGLFGSMIFACVRPIFGNESFGFSTVGVGLCCVGAVACGCAATLVPNCALAASAGAMLGLPLLLMTEGRWNPGIAVDTLGSDVESGISAGVFVGLTFLGWLGVTRNPSTKKRVEIATFAGAGAWLAVLGLDRALCHGEALWARVVTAARGNDASAAYPANDDDDGEAAVVSSRLSNGLEAAGVVAWLAVAAGLALTRAAAEGLWRPRRNGYRRVATQQQPPPAPSGSSSLLSAAARSTAPHAPTMAAEQHASLVAERPTSFNLFDPERLPASLQRFAPQIFASAEALGNFFGFQDDSVRNQAEHALALLANALAQQRQRYDESVEAEPPVGEDAEDAAVRALHAKLFSNYRSWCAALETVPQFAPPAESRREAGGAAVDIMLWLCVWGEAANLRHMPECLCYLYHSAAAEWASTPKREREGERGASLDAGHWLDTVVAPIYEVVASNMRKKADHVEKRNYDDFNEFFWSKQCLECHRSKIVTVTAHKHLERRATARRAQLAVESAALLGGGGGGGGGLGSGEATGVKPPAVADRMSRAPKTYLEVRTWLHVVFAFQRVYEFHVLAFGLLAALGFQQYLVWDWTFAVQVASSAAAAQNGCALCWGFLEALFAPPSTDDLARAALCARLAARYVALAFQCTYLCWSFDLLEQMPAGEVRRRGDAAFWWWQHVWLSIALMAPYFVEALLQLWPRGMTALYELDGDVARAVLAVFLPRSSALYVGKSVHEPYSLAWKYHTFWVTLIAFKLWFGYTFLVEPLVAPSVQIYDDYLNFPTVEHRAPKTMAQLAGRWLPSIFIFLIDSSIWYSLWAAAVGTYVGFAVKLGVVRDFASVRDAFLLLPRAFCNGFIAGGLELSAAPKRRGGGSQQQQQQEAPGGTAAAQEPPASASSSSASSGLNGRKKLGGTVSFTEDVVAEQRRASTPPSSSSLMLETSPRSSVAPELRRYFDDDQGLLERQGTTTTGCSSCCAGVDGDRPPPPPSQTSMRLSPRSLGTLISPPSSSPDLAASLGAAGRYGGGALAPRLPSFLSLSDAIDAGDHAALLFGGHGKTKSDPNLSEDRSLRTGLVELMGDPSSSSRQQKRSRVSEVFSGAEDEAQWILFAEAWNEIVDAMRASDILSNKERDILTFDRFAGFSKPVYLPIFVTAGATERATALAVDAAAAYRPLADAAAASRRDAADMEDGSSLERHAAKYGESARQVSADLAASLQSDVVATEALDELRELATWLMLRLLGPVHRDDIVAVVSIIDRWTRGNSPVPGETVLDRVKLEDAHRAVVVPLGQLVDSLLKGLPKRKLPAAMPAHPSSSSSGTPAPSSTTTAVKGATGGGGHHAPPGSPGDVSPVPSTAAMQPPTPPPTPVSSLTNLALAGGDHDDALDDPPATSSSGGDPHPRLAPQRSHTVATGGAGADASETSTTSTGMKRTQSTSGLVAMATSLSDLSGGAGGAGGGIIIQAQTSTKKYSLSSNKYVSAAKHLKSGKRAVEATDPFRDGVREKLRALLSGIKASVVTNKGAMPSLVGKSAQEVADRVTFVLANERGFLWESTYAAACLDALRRELDVVTKILKKLRGLLSTPQRETEPRGHEATRRLTFFVNSLLMDLPPPPPVEAMVSFTTLTPFYSEDVILAKGDLLSKNSDGVTTLLYLQTLYKADWENFLERRRIKDDASVFKPEHVLETRLWASFRAQTLARTVEGMMHCEAALRLLARLERLHAVRRARRESVGGRAFSSSSENRGLAPPGSSGVSVDDVVKLKFGYVVSCQVYGKQRKNEDPKAKDIELLLYRFPMLRVAYIDEQRVNRAGAVAFYSVLVKAAPPSNPAAAAAEALLLKHNNNNNNNDSVVVSPAAAADSADADAAHRPLHAASAPALVASPAKPARDENSGAGASGGVVEIYRIRLPGNPVIGEGKPENQSHAIIFTRGECLQTIDMNQDGFFEEALKMRNLLQEFRPGAPGVPKIVGSPPTTIVGFREHIFTGSVSSLANYMALQELSFVTLGQRVLSDPLRMRLHYGHPDIFDKLWFATRGGVSKASKGINLSEDIFAGYTAVIRGGAVVMKEYVQVGKGRDVGMQQIYKFEAKLSQGNAEQCLSRDASRVADRLDFPRLLSYYFGGIGHYINSLLTIATIQVATYLALLLAVFGAESIGGRQIVPLGAVQIVLAGLGLLNTLPLLATLAVERGLLPATRDVLQVFATGGPLYFVFHIQTRAHYFFQTLVAGGASYKGTGRGFVTRHSTFDEQYRFFATSHLYLGVELAAALVLIGIYSSARQYAGRTWSLWLATAAFLLAPFWFNPLGFSWPHVTDDFRRWLRWISPYTHGGTSADSWEVWYKEETSVFRRLSVQSKLFVGSKAILYVSLARGLAWKSGKEDTERVRRVELDNLLQFATLAAALAALLLVSVCVDAIAYRLHYAIHRLLKMVLGVATVAVCVAAFVLHRSFIHFATSLYYVAAAVNIVGTLLGVGFVRHLQRVHDALIGYAFFVVFIFLSALHIFDVIQTWLLFHNALSQGVVVDDILKQARRSQEADEPPDTTAELRDLRRIVEQQQRTIADLLAASSAKAAAAASSSRDAKDAKDAKDAVVAGAQEVASDTNLRAVRTSIQSAVTFELAPVPAPAPVFTFQSPDQMPPREDAPSRRVLS